MKLAGFLAAFVTAFVLCAMLVHLTVYAFEVIGNAWGVALLWIATSLTVSTLMGRFARKGGE